MTPFHFEHDFHNATPADVIALYFDPEHSDAQDQIAGIAAREILEQQDEADTLMRVTKVFPKRQLPAVARALVSGPLHYVERLLWHKREDRIELEIRPSVMSGRTHIDIVYHVAAIEPRVVRRTYKGAINVEVKLIGGRVERYILDDLQSSLQATARCTQDWLDRRATARPS